MWMVEFIVKMFEFCILFEWHANIRYKITNHSNVSWKEKEKILARHFRIVFAFSCREANSSSFQWIKRPMRSFNFKRKFQHCCQKDKWINARKQYRYETNNVRRKQKERNEKVTFINVVQNLFIRYYMTRNSFDRWTILLFSNIKWKCMPLHVEIVCFLSLSLSVYAVRVYIFKTNTTQCMFMYD